MERARLIERKHEVIARIGATRRRLDHELSKPRDRRTRRRVARLEAELQSLADEESRLRAAIDRAPR